MVTGTGARGPLEAETSDDREAMLTEAEAGPLELAVTLESIPDPVWIVSRTGLEKCNAAARTLFGSSDGPLPASLGTLARQMDIRDAVTGEPLGGDDSPLVRAVRDGARASREIVVRLVGGAERQFLVSAGPIVREGAVVGAVSVWTDVSEARANERAERVARAEAEHALATLDAMLLGSPTALALVDHDLRVRRANDALGRLSGRAVSELLGRPVIEALGAAGEAHQDHLVRALTGDIIRDVESSWSPTTSCAPPRWVLSSYGPVRLASGQIIGATMSVVDITETKRAEAELADREALFRAMADNLPLLAWMAGPDGAFYWFNRRWFDYTGSALDAARGWGWTEALHPDHVEHVVRALRRSFEAGTLWEDTFPIRSMRGEYRWFLSRAVPIRDEAGNILRWFGTNTDVTKQRVLGDITAALVSSLDGDAMLAKVTRLLVPALVDSCAIHLGDPGSPLRCAARASVDVREDGPAMTTLVIPLVARGRTLGTITFGTIRRRHGSEEARQETLTELARRVALAIDNARLYGEAQHAVRLREDVLAVVSHDLRNPLGSIAMATALLDKEVQGNARRRLEAIERAATRMNVLIDDLLDMASIQAGRLAIEVGPEDATALFAEAVDSLRPIAGAGGIAIDAEIELSGVTVSCDRNRIFQVLGNLVGNALKFSEKASRVRICARRDGDEVVVAVSDQGSGIAEDLLPRVFDPYWSAREHTKKGTGLGLFICKGIIAAHGARIWAESTLGVGTTMSFTLPLATGAESA